MSTTTVHQNLDDFTSYVMSRKCSKCSTQIIRSSEDASSLFKRWLTGKDTMSPWLKCGKCSKSSCIACNSETSSKQSQIDVEGTQISWCCSRGRLFIIWVLLCGFDEQFSASKQRETTKSKTGRTTQGSGIGYGGATYGKFRSFGSQASRKPLRDPKAQNVEQVTDKFSRMVLAFLGHLLPSRDRESRFDRDPPGAVTSMLLQSSILGYCAELLRNDSLSDAAKRKDLYQALLSFLRTIGTHPLTADSTVFGERPVRSGSDNLSTMSFRRNVSKAGNDTSSPLAENLRNLDIQSNMMLKGAKTNEKEFQTKDGNDLLWLCRQISDLSQYLFATRKDGQSDKSKAREPSDRGLNDVPDVQIFSCHAYARSAKALTSSRPGRMKHLITEITSLKTSLPPGIFVRYASSRPDVLKALIIGPDDTPYENGIFEFDFFCPGTYPTIPPLCKFRRARPAGQNPLHVNIHPDGKVCVSLLGTAPGDPWRPGESTLLQVLISIQALIFCEKPAFSEPSDAGAPENPYGEKWSNQVNQAVRGVTWRYYMLDYIKNPSELWQDLVKSHFKKNANRILQNAERWANDDQSRSSAELRKLLSELQQVMRSYGVTSKPRVIGNSSLPSSQRETSRQVYGGEYGQSAARGKGFGSGYGTSSGRGGFGGFTKGF